MIATITNKTTINMIFDVINIFGDIKYGGIIGYVKAIFRSFLFLVKLISILIQNFSAFLNIFFLFISKLFCLVILLENIKNLLFTIIAVSVLAAVIVIYIRRIYQKIFN